MESIFRKDPLQGVHQGWHCSLIFFVLELLIYSWCAFVKANRSITDEKGLEMPNN